MDIFLAASTTPYGGIAPKVSVIESVIKRRMTWEEIDKLLGKGREKKETMDVYLASPSGQNNKIWRDNASTNPQKSMDIFLAGGSTGNNNKIWRENASTNPQKPMDIFLAGTNSENNRANSEGDFAQKISILESFYYIKDWMIPYIRDHWHFLLDSGAFTFMSNTKNARGVDWDEYVERYADFINKNDIDLFFELDIDAVVGLEEVERLRAKLHKLTNKQSIPVWHKSRGKDYWLRMVQEYDYVALGGMVAGGVSYRDKVEKVFPYFIKTALQNKCKIHALGYTSLDGLVKYKFSSVDSTSWLYGNRGGYIYKFTGTTIKQIKAPEGMRLKGREAGIHNFREWVKFQQYAKNNL